MKMLYTKDKYSKQELHLFRDLVIGKAAIKQMSTHQDKFKHLKARIT